MNIDADGAVLVGSRSRKDLHAHEIHWCPPLVSADEDCRLMTSPFWRYRGPPQQIMAICLEVQVGLQTEHDNRGQDVQ